MTSSPASNRSSHGAPGRVPTGSSIPVLVVFGATPEAIKLCPLTASLDSAVVCVTGQHREMPQQALKVSNINPKYDLELMQPKQTLTGFTARLLTAFEPVVLQVEPLLIVVQRDTATTFDDSLVAFRTP